MLATLKLRKPSWTLARADGHVRFCAKPNALGNALGESIVDEMSLASLPDAVKQMPREQQRRILELSQRAGADLSNQGQLNTILQAHEAQQGEVTLSREERLSRTGSFLRLSGASQDVVTQIQQTYQDNGVVWGARPAANAIDATPASDIDEYVPQLREVIVKAQKRGVFLDPNVDVAMVGAGELVQKFGQYVGENPLAKYALMGLDIAAGPVAFAIRQGIEHSFIGDAIRTGQEAFVNHVGGQLSTVGYSDSESLSGGVGGLALLMMGAQGFTGGVKNVTHTLEQIAGRSTLREALGLTKGAPYQAHHLITQALAKDSPAIQHLMEKGLYNLHNKENGIALPNNAKLAEELGMPFHNGPHTNYSEKVRNQLNEIDTAFLLGKLNNQQLTARVSELQNNMRTHVSTLKGRLD